MPDKDFGSIIEVILTTFGKIFLLLPAVLFGTGWYLHYFFVVQDPNSWTKMHMTFASICMFCWLAFVVWLIGKEAAKNAIKAWKIITGKAESEI